MFSVEDRYLVDQISSILKNVTPLLLCSDVDGVLTVSRDSFLLDLEAIELLRRLESMDMKICLASANAHPIVKGLARYLGFSPIVIAENGCLIEVDGEVEHLVKDSAKDIAIEIARRFGLEESWQNIYRFHDYALRVPHRWSPREVEEKLREIASFVEKNYPGFRARYSGYALHIYPEGCSKGRALERIAKILGIDLGKVIAIGDSAVDAEMLEVAGLGVAVGDADEEAKRAADLVVPGKASSSVKLFLSALAIYLLSRGR